MNDLVLQELYDRAVSQGYQKDINEFKSLLENNNEVIQDNYDYVKSKGYEGDLEGFKGEISALKKKDLTLESQSQEGSTESEETKLKTFADLPGDLLEEIKQDAQSISSAWNRGWARGDQAEEVADVNVLTPEMIDYNQIAENEKELKELEKFKSQSLKDLEKNGIFYTNVGTTLAAMPEQLTEVFAQMIRVMGSKKVMTVGAGTAATVTATGLPAIPIVGQLTTAGTTLGSMMTASTYISEYGGSIIEAIKEEKNEDGTQKYDLTDPLDVQRAFENKDVLERAKSYANKRGVPVAAVDAITMKLGSIFGKTFRKSVAKGTMSKTSQAARLSAIESVGGSLGELAGQVSSKGRVESWEDIVMEGYLELGAGSPNVFYNMYEAEGLNSVKNRKLTSEIKTIKEQIKKEKDPKTKEVLMKINEKKVAEKNKANKELSDNFSEDNKVERKKIKELNQEFKDKKEVLDKTEDADSKKIIEEDLKNIEAEVESRLDNLKNYNNRVKLYKIGDKVANKEPLTDAEQKIYDENKNEINNIYEDVLKKDKAKEKKRIKEIKETQLDDNVISLLQSIKRNIPFIGKFNEVKNKLKQLTIQEEAKESGLGLDLILATDTFKSWKKLHDSLGSKFTKEQMQKLIDKDNSFLKKEEVDGVIEDKKTLSEWINETAKKNGKTNYNDGVKYVDNLINMRNHIDKLSNFILENSNIVKAYTDIAKLKQEKDPEYVNLIDVIKNNIGKYVTNSYESTHKKDYDFNQNVEETRRKAEIKFEKELLDDLKKKNPKLSQDRLNNLAKANNIKEKASKKASELIQSLQRFVKQNKQNIYSDIGDNISLDKIELVISNSFNKEVSKLKDDVGIFKRRKDMDDILKTFLGQYRDAGSQYINTIDKLAKLKYDQLFNEDILRDYEGDLIFDNPPDLDNYTLYDSNEVNPANPLKGKWIDNDLYRALQNVDQSQGKVWTSALSLMRQIKTVFNLPNIRKNITGNWYAMLQNGYFNTGNGFFHNSGNVIANLSKSFYNNNTGKLTPEFKKSHAKASKYGLTGQSVGRQLLLDDATDVMANIYSNEGNTNPIIKTFKKISFGFQNWFSNRAKNLYSNVDDFSKVAAFEAENINTALEEFGIEYENLSDKQKIEVEKKAAEKVKNTFPTWSRVPNFVKRGSKVAFPNIRSEIQTAIDVAFGKKGFLGDFVSFKYEAMRTYINSIKEIPKSIKKFREMKEQIKNETDPNKIKILEARKNAYLNTFWRRSVGVSALTSVDALFKVGGLSVASNMIFQEGEGSDEESFQEKKEKEVGSYNQIRKFFPDWMAGHTLVFDHDNLKYNKEKDRYEIDVVDYSLENPYAIIQDPIFNVLINGIEERGILESIGEISDLGEYNMLVKTVTEIVSGKDVYDRDIDSKLLYIITNTLLPPNINKAWRDVSKDGELNLKKLEDYPELLTEFFFARDYSFSPDQQFGFKMRDFAENKTKAGLEELRDLYLSGRLYSNLQDDSNFFQALRKRIKNSRLTKEEKIYVEFGSGNIDKFTYDSDKGTIEKIVESFKEPFQKEE